MMSRLAAAVLSLSMILMGTVSPAEACVLRCLGSHAGAHEHHTLAASSGMHAHAGMRHVEPVSSSSVGARLCSSGCSAVVAEFARKSLPQERVNPLHSAVVDVRAAECDGSAVAHFEVAGPPGLARCGKLILRI